MADRRSRWRQLRSAFGAGSAGAALTSLVTAGVDMSLLDEGTFVGAAFGAGVVDESVAEGVAVVDGGVLLSAGAAVVEGCCIGCCISCDGAAGAGSVVVCADTKPTVPTMVAAAMAAVRVLEAFIE
jgi:hypothetical protein